MSALGSAWGWDVLQGSRVCSWEAIQPIPVYDIHSLVQKSFADLSPSSALKRELLHNTLLLLLVLVASAYQSGVIPTTTAWGARTETFSDDLKFAVPKI
jgi:UDP-N-acetylglucosamine 2-epimerase